MMQYFYACCPQDENSDEEPLIDVVGFNFKNNTYKVSLGLPDWVAKSVDSGGYYTFYTQIGRNVFDAVIKYAKVNNFGKIKRILENFVEDSYERFYAISNPHENLIDAVIIDLETKTYNTIIGASDSILDGDSNVRFQLVSQYMLDLIIDGLKQRIFKKSEISI